MRGVIRGAIRGVRRALAAMVVVAILLALALAVVVGLRQHPQDMPWTKLRLDQPVGMFTGQKLTALTGDMAACRALLDQAGVRYTALPPLRVARSGGVCGYDDAVRLLPGGARHASYAPAGLGTSCAVAASMVVWEWQFVQPEAQVLLGSPVAAVEHFGSYNCRRIGGRGGGGEGGWSEHATADAIDIAGFRLADGRRITIARDWRGDGPEATFLHRVRRGACRLFATTLSPDYNAAHRDHLHLDQAARGQWGWRGCR